MYISPVYNKTLLDIIAKYKNINKDVLKSEYAPERQGYVAREASFDDNLKTLKDMGCISIEDNNISFIDYP